MSCRGTRSLEFFAAVYRRLLVVLPDDLRAQYAGEMSLVFRDCCRDAFERGGTIGVAAEFAVGILDLLKSAVTENVRGLSGDRWRILSLLSIATAAVVGGIYAGIADIKNSEWPGPVLMAVIFAFTLGFLRPAAFWLTGLLVGSMLPGVHYLFAPFSREAFTLPEAQAAMGTWVMVMPALSASIVGALLRPAINYTLRRSLKK